MNEESEVMGNTQQVDSLKDKLRAVTEEIDVLKNSFSKGAQDLARIQSMLDISNIDDMSSAIARFEGQVAEAERQKAEAAEGAKKYSEELEKEKERLVKLWDAYKNQEEELSTTEKKIADYEERTKTAESSMKQMEDDYNARINTLTQKMDENEGKVNQFDEYKTRCEEFDTTQNRLEQELYEWKEQVTNKDNEIHSINLRITELEGQENYSEYKNKYEEVNAEYEKEKDRLTKLYQLYEDTDAECKKLRAETSSWQQWYDSNKEIFNKLFSQYPPTSAPMQNIEMPTISPDSPTENPSKKKPKKKFKFK